MSTLVVKNLPDELHERLRQQAKRNHRSVTKEALNLIESGLIPPQPKPKKSPPLNHAGDPIAIEEIVAAIEDGRYSHFRSQDEVNAWVDKLRQDPDVAP